MNTDAPSILVVDDEPDNCQNMADILTDLGYRVDVALDGPAALELVRKQRYDVALLDLMMPGMDGASLYGEMKKLRAEMVALVVTAHPNNPRTDVALAEGAWKVVPKPVEFPRLLALVDEALAQPLVLVVDDDHDLCQTLWDILRERGYRVCLAHDTEEAAGRLRDGSFSVILLDMKLPDGDGVEVLRRARQADPGAEVVIITGHAHQSQQGIDQALAEGARGVLHKPFDVRELLAVIQRLVEANAGCASPG